MLNMVARRQSGTRRLCSGLGSGVCWGWFMRLCSNVRAIISVNVDVILGMDVNVLVHGAVNVSVPVGVRLISDRPADTPYKIDKPEREQQPTGKVPAKSLNRLQLEDRDAEGDPDQPQNNRAEHMADTAKHGHQERLVQRPATGTRHGHKGQVMIRAEQGVEKPY